MTPLAGATIPPKSTQSVQSAGITAADYEGLLLQAEGTVLEWTRQLLQHEFTVYYDHCADLEKRSRRGEPADDPSQFLKKAFAHLQFGRRISSEMKQLRADADKLNTRLQEYCKKGARPPWYQYAQKKLASSFHINEFYDQLDSADTVTEAALRTLVTDMPATPQYVPGGVFCPKLGE